MERDFMGLGSKETSAVVKEEIPDSIVDSASGIPWPFVSMGSALPHFMSFKACQGDRTKKMASVPTSSPGEIQNMMGVAVKQHLLPGFPLTVPSPVGPIVGVTEPCYNFKASPARGQMTIFYAGTVNVYDNISFEKAQAITQLAANGSSMAFNQRSQVPAPSPKLVTASDAAANQPFNSQPITDHVHNVVHSGSGSNSNDEVANKTSGLSAAPVSKPEPQRLVSSLSPIPLTTMIPSAVPQARKASLARFIEKRKERVMSAAPYSCEKKPQKAVLLGTMS